LQAQQLNIHDPACLIRQLLPQQFM